MVLLYILLTSHWMCTLIRTWSFLGAEAIMFNPDFGPTVLESVLFGIFCALTVQAVYSVTRRGLRARSHQAMLAAALAMYGISFAHWAIQISALHRGVFALASGVIFYNPYVVVWQYVPLVLVSVNILFSDTIVLWRMCVLCGQKKRAQMLAIALLLPNVVLCILNLKKDAAPGPLIAGSATGPYSATLSFKTASFSDSVYGTSVLALSLATNTISTLVIGWRTWLYSRDIAAHLASFSRRSIVVKVMVLLVESGCVYCVIWALYIVDSKSTAFSGLVAGLHTAFSAGGSAWFNHLMAQFTGIYPTIIIVLVALEQSFLEHALSESKLSAFVAAGVRPVARSDSGPHMQLSSSSSARVLRPTGRTEDTSTRHEDSVGSLDGVQSAGEGTELHSSGENEAGRAPSAPSVAMTDIVSLRSVHVELRHAIFSESRTSPSLTSRDAMCGAPAHLREAHLAAVTILHG
ncbi:hypothetical protein PENSPDRAFT_444529 [Peniophora sp. CONT]|nr:hypothetical protein PENSPDRAFT_444529 [Peniophora sp. CONT]